MAEHGSEGRGAASDAVFPKARLDALTDGVFAFAMTLLVINLEIPEAFRPGSNADLLAAFRELDSPLIAYVITFLTLAVRWLGQARTRGEPERVHGAYVWAVLSLLFFVTVMPFSTLMVGRYDDMPAAIWLYAANMILSCLASLWISFLTERELGAHPVDSGRIELVVLIASALLSVALSFVAPAQAMLAYLINAFSPAIRKAIERRYGEDRW